MKRALLTAFAFLAACGGEDAAGTSGGGMSASFGHQDPNAAAILNGTCSPHGERFEDVYACDIVDGPSAHEPPGAVAQVEHDPDTLDDIDHDWVLAELRACSCSCCHADDGIGTYIWSSSFEPAWSDSAADGPLSTLGASGANHTSHRIPLEVNNGFSREETGHPTTDPERFATYVERELARRGL